MKIEALPREAGQRWLFSSFVWVCCVCEVGGERGGRRLCPDLIPSQVLTQQTQVEADIVVLLLAAVPVVDAVRCRLEEVKSSRLGT